MSTWREPAPGFLHWRQRWIWHWFAKQAYASGLISSSVWSSHGNGWIVHRLGFGWGKRPYVLWLKRECWGYPFHWLRYHHWPETVFLGMCGKCAPWVCCGATGYDHAEGCEEA